MSNPGRYRNNKPITDTTGRRGQWKEEENFQPIRSTGRFGKNKRMVQQYSQQWDTKEDQY